MYGIKMLLYTLSCILALMAVALLIALPSIRLWQVSRALETLLQDPEGEPKQPRSLRRVAPQLALLRGKLLSQQQEVREEVKRRQDLIAFLAHDLKTPLTSVLGYLQLLKDEPDLPAEQREKYTGIALDKARRLEELVGEFFDINTMDLAQEGEENIQLSLLLEQLWDEFYPLFAEKELTGEPDIQPHLTVKGDGDRLARVFDNVLRNAVKYSTPGTDLGLTARGEAGMAVVTITNQGLEIPEKELSNIFQKFYRLDAARSTRTGGAGLGLAIAKEIVDAHGGSIRAESTGSTTAFVISLPLVQ